MDFIQKHIDKPWDWFEIIGNPSIPLNYGIERFEMEYNLINENYWSCFGLLNHSSKITATYFQKYIDKKWNFKALC
jgi:hypothetical protein